MARIIEHVPDGQVNFVVNIMLAAGLTEIEKIKENGTWTIIGKTPAPSGLAAGVIMPGNAGSAPTGIVLGEDVTDSPAISLSASAAEFMVGEESFVPFRYHDVNDNATIGYGHHRGFSKDQIDAAFPRGLTENEAWQLFLQDCDAFANEVRAKVTRDLKQHQFDALVMICFHRGNINPEAPLANDNDDEKVADSIASLRTVGGRFNRSVAERSQKTADIYRHGVYPLPKKTRTAMRGQALQLIKKLYPERLNMHGNRFGRSTEEAQRKQAEEAFFRMTGEML